MGVSTSEIQELLARYENFKEDKSLLSNEKRLDSAK